MSLEDRASSLFGRTRLGISLSSYLSLDLSLTNSFSRNGVIFISIDSSIDLLPEKRLSPFAVLGAGAGIIDSDGSTTTKALFNTGIGLRYSLYKDTFLILDIRDYILENSSRNWALSGGIVFYFDPVSTSSTGEGTEKTDRAQAGAGQYVSEAGKERPLIEVRTAEKPVTEGAVSGVEGVPMGEVKVERTDEKTGTEKEASQIIAKVEPSIAEAARTSEKLLKEQKVKETKSKADISNRKKSRMLAKKREKKKKVYEKAVLYGEATGQKQTGPEDLLPQSKLEERLKEGPLPKAERRDLQETPVPEEEKVTIKKNSAEVVIEFNLNETSISPENQKVLREFVMKVKDKKLNKIIIEGHACAHGPKSLNLIISKKRALSVKRFLRDHGIKKSVTVRFYGEERLRFKEIPTPDNINDPHVRANRRVRIVAYW